MFYIYKGTSIVLRDCECITAAPMSFETNIGEIAKRIIEDIDKES